MPMNIHLPNYHQLWQKQAKENRRLRSERHQLLIDLAVANIKVERATNRADALEKANDELRTDLSSWMDKAVSSDG